MCPRLGCIFSPSTRLSSLYLFQSKFGDSTRMVTFFADMESGDSYRQMVPPCIDAGPASGSFSFSPITCSASALVTSLQASNSAEAPDAGVEVAGLAPAFAAPASLVLLLFWLHAVKVNRASSRKPAMRCEIFLRRINGPSLLKR